VQLSSTPTTHWAKDEDPALPQRAGRFRRYVPAGNYAYDSNPGFGITTHALGGSLRCNTTGAFLQHDFHRELRLPFGWSSGVKALTGHPADRASICKLIWVRTATDKDGKLISIQYPLSGPHLGITYDSMARATRLPTCHESRDRNGVTYGASTNALDQCDITESRTYNLMFS